MKILFSKMHGLGNDFVLINNLSQKLSISREQFRRIADRKLGVGCDQILLIDHAQDQQSDFYYRIYNSDGSAVGQCGNGARCVIAYLIKNKLTTKAKISLQTDTTVIAGQMLDNGNIELDLNQPIFNPTIIGLNRPKAPIYHFILPKGRQFMMKNELEFRVAWVGNPHAIVVLTVNPWEQEDIVLSEFAQLLQDSGMFAQGVNVNFVQIQDRHKLRLKTYERGCGFTLACGSGACAVAATLIHDKLVEAKVQVEMPGGELQIEWIDQDASQNGGQGLLMRGSAAHVFDGEIDFG